MKNKGDLNMKIYSYRYLWRIGDDNKINFKIITDTETGLKQFEDALLKMEGISLACKEYLYELDVDKITRVEKIYGGDNNEKTESK